MPGTAKIRAGINQQLANKLVKSFLAGQEYEVNFQKVNDDSFNDLIDQAYEHKYQGSPYLKPMVQSGPKSATIEVILK